MTSFLSYCTDFSNIPELIAQLQDNYQYWLEQYSPPPTSENEATDHVRCSYSVIVCCRRGRVDEGGVEI